MYFSKKITDIMLWLSQNVLTKSSGPDNGQMKHLSVYNTTQIMYWSGIINLSGIDHSDSNRKHLKPLTATSQEVRDL